MISPFGHHTDNKETPYTPYPPSPFYLNPTDEVEALMGNPPRWIVRWGISVIGFIVLCFFILSFIVKYPDIQSAKVVLTTEKPPIRLMAMTNGKINQFFVSNGVQVDSGAVLGVLENAANWQDVLALEKHLLTLRHAKLPPLSTKLLDTLTLGNLQATYAQLVQNSRDFTYFQSKNGINNKVENLKQQISKIEKLKKSLEQQHSTLSKEIAIAQKDISRNQQLFSQGIISGSDLEKFSIHYLQMTRQAEGLKTQILNNDIQQKQLEAQILDLSQSKQDNTNGKSLTVDADINRLLGEIQEWKRVYLLVAPISGKVSMMRIWSSQQYVNIHDEVMTLVPQTLQTALDSITKIIAKAALPIAGAGKVKIGQDAQIRLESYPYQEFGSLEGRIESLSLVPQQDHYLVEISLKNQNLTTTYNKQLVFRQEMQGVARIITEDRSIANRIFNQMVNLFKNRG